MSEVSNQPQADDPEPGVPPNDASNAERDEAAMAWLAWYHRNHQPS
jgi:hypothetical protein